MQDISAIDKASILVEALPYIKRFHGKTVVIKYGGNAMLSEELKEGVLKDVVLMQLVGMRPVLVHGGGPDINSVMEQMRMKVEFVNGQRVTDENVMEVVEMVLTGKVNSSIVKYINQTAALLWAFPAQTPICCWRTSSGRAFPPLTAASR